MQYMIVYRLGETGTEHVGHFVISRCEKEQSDPCVPLILRRSLLKLSTAATEVKCVLLAIKHTQKEMKE